MKMAPLPPNDKKVRDVRKVLKRVRAEEDQRRQSASSRSTGIRNVYKASHEALAEIEEIIER